MNIKITGRVIHGDGYGKKLGFPTVNLEAKAPHALKGGVYAGRGMLNGMVYRAGIILGPSGKIEAHLIGYDGYAYGQEVTLEVKKFLREYKKFETEKELILQITEDIKACSQE